MLGSIEIFLISGSIPSINNMQLRASPCFTPFFILYLPALWLLSWMCRNIPRQFLNQYDSRVVNYDRRAFIRWSSYSIRIILFVFPPFLLFKIPRFVTSCFLKLLTTSTSRSSSFHISSTITRPWVWISSNLSISCRLLIFADVVTLTQSLGMHMARGHLGWIKFVHYFTIYTSRRRMMMMMEKQTWTNKVNTGTGPIKILQRKFYATRFFRHFDWMLIIFHQSKCLKKSHSIKFTL